MGFQSIPKSEIAGATVITAFAGLSTLAVVSIVVRMLWLAVKPLVTPTRGQPSPREFVFFHTQLGLYSACLLLANLCNGSAGLIGVYWIMGKGIPQGRLCDAQGVIMQTGNFATAYFTVTMGIHTFNTLVLRRPQSGWLCATVLAIGWMWSIIMGITPLLLKKPLGVVLGPSGVSCGVTKAYPLVQFLLNLLPIFLALITSAVVNSVVYLSLRGTLVLKGGIKLNLDPQTRWDGRVGSSEEYHRFIAAIARSMLWYPIAYTALLLPYAVTRLLDISGFHVSFDALVFAWTCWFLLGLVNVMLLYNTFRVLGPIFETRSQASSSARGEESFSTSGKFTGPVPTVQTTHIDTPSISRTSTFAGNSLAYEYPAKLSPQSHTLTHQKSFSTLYDNSSIRPLVSNRGMYHVQAASIDSSLTVASAEMLERTISPISQLNKDIMLPPASAQPAVSNAPLRIQTERHRQPSTESLSLPPAPRYSRSPISRRPTLESIRSPNVGPEEQRPKPLPSPYADVSRKGSLTSLYKTANDLEGEIADARQGFEVGKYSNQFASYARRNISLTAVAAPAPATSLPPLPSPSHYAPSEAGSSPTTTTSRVRAVPSTPI